MNVKHSSPSETGLPQRILYFDAIESFAIFLVVSVHSVWLNATVPASISMSISPSAVPLFFMVHGALLLSKPHAPSKHWRRCVRILLQLLAWSTIYLLISLALGWNKHAVSLHSIYQYYFEGQVLNGTMGLGGSLWFIYALLFVYLLHPILIALRASSNALKYLALLLFIFVFGSEAIHDWGTYIVGRFSLPPIISNDLLKVFNPLGRYGNCVFYYILGYLVALEIQNRQKNPHDGRPRMMLASLALILAGIALLMLERKIEFGTFAYNWKPLTNQYCRIGGTLQAVGYFVLFSQLSFNERLCGIMQALSTHTIDIYYIHPIVVKLLYDFVFIQSYAGVLQNYLRAAAALLVSYLFGQIIRRIPLIRKIL